MTAPPVAIVVIGRNEGQRLRRCLESIRSLACPTVYVDSRSDDDSVDIARSMGIEAIILDDSAPLSAARGRNEGFRFLQERFPDLPFVQFVDGDCELDPSWIETALRVMHDDPSIAALCGTLRERNADASVYNRLCQMEWHLPAGEARHCGGIFLCRSDAFRKAGMFDPAVIAGEEPDLCARMRAQGGRILRIDNPMATHDADMHRFAQWWRRAARGGLAFALTAARNGWRDRGAIRQLVSSVLWGVAVPGALLISLALIPFTPRASVPAALLALLIIAMILRIARSRRRIGDPWRHALLYAIFCMLAKTAQVVGMLRWLRMPKPGASPEPQRRPA